MNEELQKQVLEMLKDGKSFVIEQAPDVVQQYVALQAVGYLGWCALFVLCALVSFFIFSSMYLSEKKNGYGQETIPLCFGIVVGTILSLGMLSNAINYYSIKTYPKGYLLDKALMRK